MKNVRETQLKTAIFLELEEYEEILSTVYERTVRVHPDLDGIWYEAIPEEPHEDFNDIHEKLSKYFDVEVNSIHADDCEYQVGIWIIYKN